LEGTVRFGTLQLMKLIFFIDSARKIGGGSYAQYVFARTLALKGHKVIIFAGDRNFYSDKLNVNNLTVHYRSSIPTFIKGIGISRVNDLLRKLHQVFIIKPFVKKYQPDWLIGYLRVSAIKAQVLGTLLNIKVANFVYETPDWLEQQLGNHLPKRLLKSWYQTQIAYEKSTVLIPNSRFSRAKMLEWIPSSRVTEPVYPGVDVDGLDFNPIVRDIDVIYLGRLHALKNINELLLASSPQHRTVIIGAGEEMTTLQEIASVRNLKVDFLGSVSDDDKWSYLKRAKLLVSPSSFEGFGMPPLEALACGCMVLCSDIPIFREVYGSDVTYFKLHDVKDLRSKISYLLALNKPSHSLLPQKYTWENATLRIEQILTQSSIFSC